MNCGFQVVSPFNTFTVDSNFRNNALVRAAPFDGHGLLAVSVVGSNPLIFFRSEHRTILTDRRQSGSTFTFYFYASGPGVYYIFDVSDSASRSGLQVFKPGEGLVFDAKLKYLRIHDMVQLEARYSNSSTFIHAPGKVLASMGSGWAQDTFSDETGQPGYYQIIRARNYISAGVGGYTIVQEEDSYFSSTPFDTGWSAAALIADVTNYPTAL